MYRRVRGERENSPLFLLHDPIFGHRARNDENMPILDMFGPPATGKTQMARAIVAPFQVNAESINLRNATQASLGEAIAEVSNAVVHIDEFKEDIDPKKVEFLKVYGTTAAGVK